MVTILVHTTLSYLWILHDYISYVVLVLVAQVGRNLQ